MPARRIGRLRTGLVLTTAPICSFVNLIRFNVLRRTLPCPEQELSPGQAPVLRKIARKESHGLHADSLRLQ